MRLRGPSTRASLPSKSDHTGWKGRVGGEALSKTDRQRGRKTSATCCSSAGLSAFSLFITTLNRHFPTNATLLAARANLSYFLQPGHIRTRILMS